MLPGACQQRSVSELNQLALWWEQGAQILSAVTTRSCEIHANIFRITGTQTISVKDLWSSNPLTAEQDRSHPCIALFRLI